MPYDQADFSVPPCVTADQKCHAVRFANLSEDKTIKISYRSGETGEEKTIRLKPGKARTVPVAPGRLTWGAAAYKTDTLWKIKPGDGSIQIASSCTSLDNPSDNLLPNTGGPAIWWMRVVGLAATITGLALLIRPRCLRRS